MTHESFTLYITRLNTIREGLTDPKRIKFIDDIFEALRYKDDVIDELHRERGRLIKVNSNSIQEGADIKLKLEGCALRWGIPGWEIEHWLRMKPDAVVREVKFWQKLKLIYIELEGIKPEPIKKPKYSYKPLLDWSKGLPSVPYKPAFSLKDIPI